MRTRTTRPVRPTLNQVSSAALIALGLLASGSASAASCTWNSTNGNWNELAKWLSCVTGNGNPGGVPGSADSASIGAAGVVTINTGQSVLNLNNAGRINIDAFGLNLVGGGSTTNTGVINVGGASTANLGISAGHNINNAGGVINVGAGSVINQFGSTIAGGTINTSGTGALVAFSSGSNFLSSVTLNGTLDMTSIGNSRQRIVNGATINGAVNIGNGGILSFDSSAGAASQAISGTATFNLNDSSARLTMEGTGTTTLGAGVIVRGQGNVGGGALHVGGNNVLVNNGLISADVAGGTLNISPPANGGSVVNNNVLRAVAGGTLQLSANVNNASGQITAGNGSVVIQNGVTVSGGVISTSGSGAFRATSSGTNVLDAVTLNGVLDLSTIGNARARIVNGATLNGAVNVANGGILSLDSNGTPGGAQVIGGSGVINLNDAAARLTVEGSGSTTLGANLTVRGQGNLGGQAILAGGNNVLTNNGLVSADVSGGTLNIVSPANGGSFINNGTLQAVGGGTLLLSTNITANPTGQIIAGAGSSVVQNGVTINGTINASGTGVFTAVSSSSNVLDGVTFNGTLDLSSIGNSRERIVNGATLNGVVNIANGGILSLDSNGGAANQTLAGTVVINMNDAAARVTVEGSGTTTLGSGVTVRGQGSLGGQAILAGGNNTLTNHGLISADVAGGTLNIVSPANGGSFVNSGTLQAVGGGTLLLSTNITANPSGQIIAGAGSSVVQNGVTINGTINASGTGVFTAVSSGSNVLDGVNFNGTLDLASIANSRERIVNGATLNGEVNISNGGILSLDSNGTAGGAQLIAGSVVINMNDAAARVTVEGNGATTLGSGVTVRGQGNLGGQAILAGGNNVLTNNGLISADVAGGTLNIVSPANGGSFVNNGTLQAVGGGQLLLSTNINSNASGQIVASNGSSVVQNGVTLTGVINSSGSGVFTAISSGSNVLNGVTFNGTLDLASIANSRERIVNGATINGVVNISNGGILALDSNGTPGGAQSLLGTAVINMNDSAARVTMEGSGATTFGAGITVRGQGSVGGPAILAGGNNTLFNNGTLLADVSGGVLNIVAPANGGTLAGTGTLQTNGGTLNLATGSASTQGRLVMGGAGSALNLNTQNLTITTDYTNAQSGLGNSFNRRAGVSGTGQILAGGNAAQAITGSNVSNGTTNNATLTISNVRVGTTSYNYQVANTGTTGPTLRGAIQTSVNGGNITDSRLSGTGVTAANYNAGAPGGNSGNQTITFTASSAGALAPLSGQAVNLRSNFDNIADQKLNIVLAGGAAAYNAAVGNTTPAPVMVANQRVGGSNSVALTVSNTAAAGAFSEDLHASGGGSTGAALLSGAGVSGLVAGNSQASALAARVDTSSAGAKSGTVTINYQTAGAVNGVSNGLGTASAGSQTVNVSGNVYQAAAGQLVSAPLNFGTVQVGQVVTQNLVVRNTATGAAGFVEDLNASFGSSSGTGAGLISGSGSLNGVRAGNSSTAGNGSMVVSVNTAAAGTVSGNIAVNYFTAGAVNGTSNGLGTAAVGSEAYGVQGQINATANVINQASPLVNNSTVNLGAVRVGAAAPSGTVSVTNVATVAPQAALSASMGATSGPATASGGFNLLNPGATNNGSLVVGLNTGTAGNFTGANAGTATINFVSDASNVGGCAPNCQLNLASQVVNVEGKVYTQAVGSASGTSINFGVVRVGDTVSARNITVNNTAAVTALNDTLQANLTGVGSAFTGNGSTGPISAQAAGLFSVGLDTSTAGIFSGSGSVGFASHNADMTDVSAGANAAVSLAAQVNNLANGDFDQTGGSGSLSQTGTTYVLDLGNVVLGSSVGAQLHLLNAAAGPADELSGSFDLSSADDFGYSGWNPLAFLAAGQAGASMSINWLAGALGQFSDTITFFGLGTNASDPVGLAQQRQLIIRANVISAGTGGNVPEPGSLALLLAAAAAGWATRLGARNGRKAVLQ